MQRKEDTWDTDTGESPGQALSEPGAEPLSAPRAAPGPLLTQECGACILPKLPHPISPTVIPSCYYAEVWQERIWGLRRVGPRELGGTKASTRLNLRQRRHALH